MRIFLSILVATFLFAAPASAQSIERLDAQNVGGVLAYFGLAYGETTDNRGFPLIQIGRSQDDGAFAATTTNIFFYGCEAGSCKDITLYSWYEPPLRTSSDQIHAWNDIHRQARNWTHAYIDEEGDTILVMNINAEGGIGEDALRALIFSFLLEAQDFGDYIGLGASE